MKSIEGVSISIPPTPPPISPPPEPPEPPPTSSLVVVLSSSNPAKNPFSFLASCPALPKFLAIAPVPVVAPSTLLAISPTALAPLEAVPPIDISIPNNAFINVAKALITLFSPLTKLFKIGNTTCAIGMKA